MSGITIDSGNRHARSRAGSHARMRSLLFARARTASMTEPSRPSPAQREPARIAAARAPARLDLAGGWTDVPPYADEVGGCVCNVAIDRYATVRIGGAGVG